MAKKITDETPLASFESPWGGTYETGANAGKEWGKTHGEVERVIKEKVGDIEQSLDGKVNGLVVNNQSASKDVNGNIHLDIPIVDTSLSTESVNTVQNKAVAEELNAIKGNTISSVRTDVVDGDTTQLDLVFTNEDGTDFASVRIPAASEMGTVTYPKVTTELLTPTRIKLGDSISFRWTYDHIIQEEGVQTSSGTAAQVITIKAQVGSNIIYQNVLSNVAASNDYHYVTLGADIISQPGTINIYVIAQVLYGEEQQRAQGFKSVGVITMNLTSSFDPSSGLALSNGYIDNQTITIPYAYSVPANTIIRIYKDGQIYDTATVSGTARGNVNLNASDLNAGYHNIQLIADSGGLLSNVVSVDFRKAGNNTEYIGIRVSLPIAQISDMPLPYEYDSDSIPLSIGQFESLSLDFASWVSSSLESIVSIMVDGNNTQTLSVDRTLHQLTQRFDVSGSHTMTISVGEATRTFAINVVAVSGVTEVETIGYNTKLTANGRSNDEGVNIRNNWGGITTFERVNFDADGWHTDSDGNSFVSLMNEGRMDIDIKPFVLDTTDNDYSIQSRGATIEMEFMVSQVIERGGTIIECLYDNNNTGYPLGFKVTTEEVEVLFGGVESIKTAEKVTDSDGNYLDSNGNIVEDEDEAADLYITRPYGVTMNIARDMWLQVAIVFHPVTDGYGLCLLYINGSLRRANRYTGALRQNVPQPIHFRTDHADLKVRGVRYYRYPLSSDEVLSNWIIDRPTPLQIVNAHDKNDVGDSNNTTDDDGNISINKDALISKGRGVLEIIRSGDSGNGLGDLFACVDKKQNFKADMVRWTPPLDGNGDSIGQGFVARNVRIRIQGTSSVKYPYKNIRIYLTTAQDGTRTLEIGGVDVTSTASGYALRGTENSIPQSVLCAKTDFVDSSMAGNTGGAHLYDATMRALDILTPPQEYDARVRQAVDGLPCDIFAGKSEQGALTYYGQFVLNNEKSKSGGIFGMEGVENFSGDENLNPMSIALEALDNNSPMTLFQPTGSANSQDLDTQLSQLFDKGFEFNFPEDAVWANIDEGQWDSAKNKWSVKPVPGARAAIKRLLGWIYDCVPSDMRTNPEYGTPAGWSDESKAKWVSQKFKTEISSYFNVRTLLTYYPFIGYLAGKDQLAKNIIWRTWDGLIWFPTFYDGDTWESLRNDSFMVYLYNITRDSYDYERAKYAFEGHSSWLWCLVLANLEEELRQHVIDLRNQMTDQTMLNEFINNMIGNWSERQYNKSGKLKYIDTIDTMNYVYTLTGSRKEHITSFITNRSKLLDARYDCGEYNGDVITFTVVREESDTPSSLTLKSGDLYYYGYKLNGRWLQGPVKAGLNENVTLTFTQRLATNDPLMLGGASCIKELDFTNMGIQLNGTVNLSLCNILTKLVMPATNGVANAPLTFGNISKLRYIDITGQTSIHTGTSGMFDVSKHTRLETLLAGNTNLTTIKIADGAPITTLVLPSSITSLTLRNLSMLRLENLTLQGTANITSLNIANCPNLDWKVIFANCPNITSVRIEGIEGKVRSSFLRQFMSGISGISASGLEQTYPALIGSVELIDVVDDFENMQTFFERCGLTIKASEYSIYYYDDEETDPANITNEDNQTGYAYRDENETYDYFHPNGYEASGHISLLHDKCQLVAGIVNPVTNKMHCTVLSKTSDVLDANGNTFNQEDPYDEGYDIFLYLPKYWYKGVNDYKNARKYFILSSNSTCPQSNATTNRYALSGLLYAENKAIDNRFVSNGDVFDINNLSTINNVNLYKVDVSEMKQVRFPGMISSYYSYAYVDGSGIIVSLDNFTMRDISLNGSIVNPADFDNDSGDYIFTNIPYNAKYLYFSCTSNAAQTLPEVIITDSTEIEAIEPDWVEHKSELIGVYSGSISGTTSEVKIGLRSLKTTRFFTTYAEGEAIWNLDEDGDPTGLPLGTVISEYDKFMLAKLRGKNYSSFTYETVKNLANLFMVWFGTRKVRSMVGGNNQGNAPWGFSDSPYQNPNNKGNRIWGLINIITRGGHLDYMAKTDMTFAEFKRNGYPNSPVSAAPGSGMHIVVVRQDGTESVFKNTYGMTALNTSLARVRHGRYCDTIYSAITNETTRELSYTSTFYNGNTPNYFFGSELTVLTQQNAGLHRGYSRDSRLCYCGDIENEYELLNE